MENHIKYSRLNAIPRIIYIDQVILKVILNNLVSISYFI